MKSVKQKKRDDHFERGAKMDDENKRPRIQTSTRRL